MTHKRLERALFATILFGYLIAGALFAIYTPPWQAPDEPAHYNYIRQVAENGCCPTIERGDWQGDYQQRLTTVRFAADQLDRLETIQYEDHHPPLYYLLASLVYKISGGDLTALRLLSVIMGALTVTLTYTISKLVLPAKPELALASMALVAFLPQHLAMLSAVNNDALAEAIVAIALLWIVRYLRGKYVPIWQFGVLAGLAILCKITIYFLLLVIPLAILLKWRMEARPISVLVQRIAACLLVALLIGGAWWLRNIKVYGFPDFLALAAHDTVVADQLRTVDYIDQHGVTHYLRQTVSVTFKSFWGQFGWMALPLDSVLGGWIYRAFAFMTLGGAAGALLQARSLRSPTEGDPRVTKSIFMTFGATILLVLLAYIYYNIEFLQWQGRYLFPALIPIAGILVAGLDYWRSVILSQWEASRWLVVMAMICLFPLDLYLLFRVIVPGLSPG